MLVKAIIQDIRNRINDKEGVGDFDDDEIVSYINQAINYIGLYFVSSGNPIAVKDIVIRNGDTLPNDYVKACGILPIKITGKTIKFLDAGVKDYTMKYFYKAPNITGTEDEEMPYDDALTNNVIVTLTVILLMNQQRLNVSQDQGLNSALMDTIESAYSARA